MEWKTIEGFNGDYEISSTGQVRSRKSGHSRPIKTKHNSFTGYDFVILGYNGSSKTKTIHRLVAEAFIPNPSNKPEVNHINEDKTDNRVENLEWVTSHENNEWSKHRRYKEVHVYSPDGEYLATFASETIAARFLGVTRGMVAMAMSNERGSCAGLILKRTKEVARWE